MYRLKAALQRVADTEDGQDLIEYAMLVALIAIAAVVAVTRVGNMVSGVMWQVISAANV